jgi:hypothetical protein
LSGDPFANVWIAIHQRDVRCFAPGQKIDAGLTGQSHIFQVENHAAALFFRADECFQLGDMLCVDPAAYRKNHFPVFRPVNSEHAALPRKTLAYKDAGPGPKRKWLKLKVLVKLTIYETSLIYEVRKKAFYDVSANQSVEPAVFREIPLNRFLLILSALIFDSRVVPGMPSLAAAPDGPDTRAPHSRKAASMMAFS